MTQRHRHYKIPFLARLFGLTKLVDDLENLRTERDTAKTQLELERRSSHVAHRRVDELETRCVELATRSMAAWIVPEKRLPEHEVRRAFSVANDAPIWIAFNQKLDDAATDLIEVTVAEPKDETSEKRRLHAAGGVDALRNFQRDLIELQRLAQAADEEIEEKGA